MALINIFALKDEHGKCAFEKNNPMKTCLDEDNVKRIRFGEERYSGYEDSLTVPQDLHFTLSELPQPLLCLQKFTSSEDLIELIV